MPSYFETLLTECYTENTGWGDRDGWTAEDRMWRDMRAGILRRRRAARRLLADEARRSQ